ncbi:hypothetical protein HZS_1789, partial [Henneguya salminicola]
MNFLPTNKKTEKNYNLPILEHENNSYLVDKNESDIIEKETLLTELAPINNWVTSISALGAKRYHVRYKALAVNSKNSVKKESYGKIQLKITFFDNDRYDHLIKSQNNEEDLKEIETRCHKKWYGIRNYNERCKKYSINKLFQIFCRFNPIIRYNGIIFSTNIDYCCPMKFLHNTSFILSDVKIENYSPQNNISLYQRISKFCENADFSESNSVISSYRGIIDIYKSFFAKKYDTRKFSVTGKYSNRRAFQTDFVENILNIFIILPIKPGDQHRYSKPQQSYRKNNHATNEKGSEYSKSYDQNDKKYPNKGYKNFEQSGSKNQNGNSRETNNISRMILTNYFKINFIENKKIVHYVLSVIPEPSSSLIQKIVTKKYIDIIISKNKPIPFVWDGHTNIFTAEKIEHCPIENIYNICREKENFFDVELKHIRSYETSKFKDLSKEEYLDVKQAIEIITKNMTPTNLIIGANTYISFTVDSSDLSVNAEGFKSKLHRSQHNNDFYLNIDYNHTKISLYGDITKNIIPLVIKNLFNQNSHNDIDAYFQNKDFVAKLNSILESFCYLFIFIENKARFLHLSSIKKIITLSNKNSYEHEFEWEYGGNKKRTNTLDYYELRYNIILKYPKLPLLQIEPKNKNIYMPIELAEIIINKIIPKNDSTTKKYSDRSRINSKDILKPNVRYSKSIEMARELQELNSIALESFGMKISAEMLSIDYNTDGTKYKTQIESIPQIKAYVFYFVHDKTSKYLCESLKDMLKNSIIFTYKELPPNFDFNNINFERLKNYFNQYDFHEISLIVVMLNDPLISSDYGLLKTYFDVNIGIPSQFITRKTRSSGFPPVIRNITRKILFKIGAELKYCKSHFNLKEFTNDSILLMGADVSHPTHSFGENIKRQLSFGSVVSSIDSNFSKYVSFPFVNPGRKETIENMHYLTTRAIEEYKNYNAKYPKKIIMFRDGLSESQISNSAKEEITSMKQALKEIFTNSEIPNITFISVQKRHHTRFYPKNDKSNNCTNGTIIQNSTICDENCFYILSHKSNLGTAKASQYRIIINDNKYSISQLQTLAHALCWNFARCETPVSLPSPTYYAHLSAYRYSLYNACFKKFDKMYDKEIDKFFSNLETASNTLKDSQCSKNYINYVLKKISLMDKIALKMY